MGLLLVGFGLRDSIMDVAILQYQDIQVYDGMIVLDADADQRGQDELKQELADDGSVEAFAEVSMRICIGNFTEKNHSTTVFSTV